MNRVKWLLAGSCLLLAFCNSCKEDTGSVGANVLPKGDLISAFQSDTTTLVTVSYIKDSVPTFYRGAAVSNCMIGSYSDPIFGTTKASTYAQVYSTPGEVTGWSDSIVDSAVLVLAYYNVPKNSFYGNLDPQTFEVDTLESALHYLNSAGNAATYYSDTTVKYDAAHPIGLEQITPPDPVSGQDTLRIKLSKNWCQYIVNKINSNSWYYTNFDSLVKGLYITVSNPLQLPGQGGIVYINLTSAFSGIYFYYHGKVVPGSEFAPIIFPVGGTGVNFTHVDHNYSTAVFANSPRSGANEEISGNDWVYIQAGGGPIGKITFPYLHNWSKMNPVVINQASVTIPINAQDDQSAFNHPLQLYLYGIDSLGYPYELTDNLYSYYGGTYNGSSTSYTFVITSYIQHVIDGKIKDRGLYIVPGYESVTPNRAVLYGARNGVLPSTSPRIKLNMYYTPLKH